MSFRFDSFPGTDRTFPLREDAPPITLDADGVKHPRSPRKPVSMLTRYEDITHLAASARMLWLGTRESVYLLPRALFANYDAPERLIDALLGQIRSLPGGADQLARIAAVEETARSAGKPRATWGLISICLAVYAMQIFVGFEIQLVGHYSPILVADGDVWRVVTANLLHAQPGLMGILHIGLNLIALLALGILVERPLGTARTICIMGVSGVASMLASGWLGTSAVVGVSGVVFGLVGGVLWLDYRRAEEMPAWSRFPRRSLLLLLAINLVLGAVVPVIALAAHVGGFVGGAAATALVTARIGARPGVGLRAAATAVVAAVFLSTATAGMDALKDGEVSARYAARYARLPGISPEELNDHAWLIAISEEPSRAQLEAALLLAERAVSETDRAEATILDTLAEVHWAMGHAAAAVDTIDEAIAHAPEDPYYQEQRRRFTGERAPDDRPEYLPPWMRVPGGVAPDASPEPEGDPGLTV